MEIREFVREYLRDSKLMHLATSVNDRPWLCHVWFAYDKDLSLYFISRDSRRHSKEILAQSRVAGGMVNHPLKGFGQKVRGLSFEGWAEELCGEKEISAAFGVYSKRWLKAKDHYRIKELVSGESHGRIFRILPERYVLFDEINFPEQPRQELTIKR
ncbi:MAG: pyridoxamine 5'-phosphate oxidase family protein [Candidatus Micrarchaeota archaeon]|nr:pyridoxamine 5'-phosphate oxidase family protein [Candidatus Micrarchaeota archaeon]MDE1847675.1 pyridoxamine 5'-phosphate oxidase family protein [Candidatus Micrarchaeota archaeon]MDE1864496.1 pyridoxamine 5'-phosphate oxidase family protein [Candidatus Micrarchaeota archaeon]